MQGFDTYRAVALSTSGIAYTWGGGQRCFLGCNPLLTIQEDSRNAKIRKAAEEEVDDSLSDIDIDLGYDGSVALRAVVVLSSSISPHERLLCCAVLCCAVLCCAVLCCAVLCCAVLCCAVLCCADAQIRLL